MEDIFQAERLPRKCLVITQPFPSTFSIRRMTCRKNLETTGKKFCKRNGKKENVERRKKENGQSTKKLKMRSGKPRLRRSGEPRWKNYEMKLEEQRWKGENDREVERLLEKFGTLTEAYGKVRAKAKANKKES